MPAAVRRVTPFPFLPSADDAQESARRTVTAPDENRPAAINPRPAAPADRNDPLSALKSMSDEELIALFT